MISTNTVSLVEFMRKEDALDIKYFKIRIGLQLLKVCGNIIQIQNNEWGIERHEYSILDNHCCWRITRCSLYVVFIHWYASSDWLENISKN